MTCQHETSLDASDDFDQPHRNHDFPTQLCESFMSLMAAHGRSVDLEVMRADRAYAMWQLARAHTVADAALREVACALFSHDDQARRVDHMHQR